MDYYQVLRKVPLARILIPYILGIFISDRYVIYNHSALILISFSVFLVMLVIRTRNKRQLSFVVLYASMFLTGLTITQIYQPKANNISEQTEICGTVVNEPQLYANSIGFRLEVRQYQVAKLLKPYFYVNVYTKPDSSLLKFIQYGDKVKLKAKLSVMNNSGNPGEFDFQKYYTRKGVLYSCYVLPDSIQVANDNKIYYLHKLRRFIRKRFDLFPFDKDVKAILIALTLGDKSELSNEVRESYINAGVIHVLAVSGLHVGIIYMFINYLLIGLNRHAGLYRLKTLIVILVIWAYAFLVGLTPSVTRAALMFSLISAANLLYRDVSYFNVLAGAALFMLLANPFQLFDIGFQLSFSAVAGIIYFHKYLYNKELIKNRILDKLYQLFLVGISAQLSTFPITLYYFNQFPSYFWLSNVFVVLLTMVVLFLAVVFIIGADITWLGNGIGHILNFTVSINNRIITFVESIPGAVIYDIDLSTAELALLIVLVLSLAFWLKTRTGKSVILMLFIVFMLVGYNIHSNINTDRHELVVFNVKNESLLTIGNGQKLYPFIRVNDITNATGNRMANVLWDYKLFGNYKHVCDPQTLYDQHKREEIKAFILNDSLIVNYIFRPEQLYKLHKSTEIHTVIIAGSLWPPKKEFSTRNLVLDSSNKAYIYRSWEEYCDKYGIHLHIVTQQGAYSLAF